MGELNKIDPCFMMDCSVYWNQHLREKLIGGNKSNARVQSFATLNLYFVLFIKSSTLTHVYNSVQFPCISSTHLIITNYLNKLLPLHLSFQTTIKPFPRSEMVDRKAQLPSPACPFRDISTGRYTAVGN